MLVTFGANGNQRGPAIEDPHKKQVLSHSGNIARASYRAVGRAAKKQTGCTEYTYHR